jgi:superoxide reductase
MTLMKEGVTDAATEKHVPVVEKVDGGFKVKVGEVAHVEKVDGGFKVKVGEVAHPMEEKHYIEWIEVIADGKAYRQFLEPGAAPEAFFRVDADNVSAREYCNLHGLWRA